MPQLGGPELAIILLICLLLFGAGKLRDVGGALGTSIKEFRKAASDEEASGKAHTAKVSEEPAPPPKAS